MSHRIPVLPREHRPAVLVVLALLVLSVAVVATASARPLQPPELGELEAACTADNPYLVTSLYARGGNYQDLALLAFRDSRPDSNETGHVTLATQRQIGATYGLAYVPSARSLFVGAFHKRGTAFGPGGPGAIYRVDLVSGAVALWQTVPSVGIDQHDRAGDYWPDTRARNFVGAVGLGDVEASPDGTELYVMNLLDRQIYRYRLADKALLGRIPTGPGTASWAPEARPFGLAVWRGRLYHGVIRTAYRSQDPSELEAYVYESALDGSGMREVNRFGLDYARGNAVTNASARWQPWKDGYNSTGGTGRNGFSVFPQPMLTDIEFADNGDMILGFRDRNGDMTFFDPGGRNPPGEGTGIPAGDIVLARFNGDTWSTNPSPEFYRQDGGPRNNPVHQETGFGGLARVGLRDVVVTMGLAPLRISSGGGFWFDNRTGNDVGREELYGYQSQVNFGKANGLGDVEVLCAPVIATPTPTATATRPATTTPTATPTALPTATVTTTPTPRTYHIYLPHGAYDEICIPDAYHADVVLVLDRSTSMLRSIEEGGLPKNEAAIAAAKQFLSRLDFTPDELGRHDQVAVVGFNDLAWTELDLTNDAGAAVAALDTIRTKTQEGTRLDLAMLEGQKPLDGPNRKPENLPVIILLTDGLPNRVPTPVAGGVQEDTVLWAAMAARARGSRVYTIGLGKPTDILPRLMIAMASESWMYYYAPRGEDLGHIYDQIAHSFDECGPHTWLTPTPCVAEIVHADVVLVLDMSTSMLRTTSAGRTKQAAAVEAGQVFVSELDVEVDGWGRQDQAAVVGFNDTAWREVPLSGDRAALEAGLLRLPLKTAEGTRLDLALAEGQRTLEAGPRLPENGGVMILLTDGLPNRVPLGPGGTQEETVLAAAAAAKARGTRVYTIGLGATTDIDAELLKAAASAPDMFYYAPDGEDLAQIYREIAGRITECR